MGFQSELVKFVRRGILLFLLFVSRGVLTPKSTPFNFVAKVDSSKVGAAGLLEHPLVVDLMSDEYPGSFGLLRKWISLHKL